METPAAEVRIDGALIGQLLAEQHPDLAALPLRRCAAGWDNEMWRLGDRLVVRLPRRSVAAGLVLHEQRWLPELAPWLPLAVPVPLRRGRPGCGYPWAWSIVGWIEGEPGDRAEVTEPEGSAVELGRFLAALHRPAAEDAPVNPWRGVPLRERTATFDERLASLAAEVDAAALRRVWREALGARPHGGPPRWLHGDLHPANIVLRRGAPVGVVDFGDLCGGDPATDLAAGWMLLPSPAMPAFFDAYGADPDQRSRSTGWAALLALMLLGIGLDDTPSYATVGRRTLARLVAATPG